MATHAAAVMTLFLFLATPVSAATFTVTSSDDSGPGTLRQAILDANANPGPDRIQFAVTFVTFLPPTPAITDNVHIDGTLLDGSRVEINGALLDGTSAFRFSAGSGGSLLEHVEVATGYFRAVLIDAGVMGVVVEFSTLSGNVEIFGNANALADNRFPPPAQWRIVVAGDFTQIVRNQISGRVELLLDAGETDITGNTFTGAGAGTGILVNNTPLTTAGTDITGNTISGFAIGVGVSTTTTHVELANNIIFNNGIPIDLGLNGPTANDPAPDADAGANGLQNYPVLTSATLTGPDLIVEGTLTSAPLTTYEIELFGDNASDPEARILLGDFQVTTDASGQAQFTHTSGPGLLTPDQVITATATGPFGTSELSAPVAIDAPGTLGFSQPVYFVDETAGMVTITVNRTGGSDGTVTVQYATEPVTATPGDYTPTSGTLTFGPGVTTQTFTIPIIADGTPEPDEYFNVTLSNATGGAALGPDLTAVTITSQLGAEAIPTASTWALLLLALGLAGVTVARLGR